jgi:hypothetical protein
VMSPCLQLRPHLIAHINNTKNRGMSAILNLE